MCVLRPNWRLKWQEPAATRNAIRHDRAQLRHVCSAWASGQTVRSFALGLRSGAEHDERSVELS
jgi:hypothetical protein